MAQETRHITKFNDNASTETLLAGEVVYMDSNTIKIGDGTKIFSQLPEFSSNDTLGDNSTIVANSAKKIQAHGTLNKNPNATGDYTKIFDWIGTSQEFSDQHIESEHPDWLCFVTDDMSGTMSGTYTRDEIDAFLSNKANGAGSAVLISSDQIIEGTKTFLNNSIKAKSSTIDSKQTPTETEYLSNVMVYDKNNVRIGNLETFHKTDGSIGLGINASVNVGGTNYYSPNITTWISQDGQTGWTETRTPATTSNNDQISTTKHVMDVLKAIYPVGAIFIGTTSTCPMAQFFGTWNLVSQDRVLQGSSANHTVDTTIAAGLPNITGTFNVNSPSSGTASGAFVLSSSWSSHGWDGSASGGRTYDFNASRSSSIYGNSSTVQPAAYVVNIWKRTA